MSQLTTPVSFRWDMYPVILTLAQQVRLGIDPQQQYVAAYDPQGEGRLEVLRDIRNAGEAQPQAYQQDFLALEPGESLYQIDSVYCNTYQPYTITVVARSEDEARENAQRGCSLENGDVEEEDGVLLTPLDAYEMDVTRLATAGGQYLEEEARQLLETAQRLLQRLPGTDQRQSLLEAIEFYLAH